MSFKLPNLVSFWNQISGTAAEFSVESTANIKQISRTWRKKMCIRSAVQKNAGRKHGGISMRLPSYERPPVHKQCPYISHISYPSTYPFIQPHFPFTTSLLNSPPLYVFSSLLFFNTGVPNLLNISGTFRSYKVWVCRHFKKKSVYSSSCRVLNVFPEQCFLAVLSIKGLNT